MTIFAALLLLYVVALCAILAAALILGGRDERRFALVVVIGFATTQVAAVLGSHWNGPEYAAMGNDAGLTIAMGLVALRSRKFWPIWATASQLNATISHLPPILIPRLDDGLYATTQTIWVAPVMAALTVGTISEARRHRRQARHLHSLLGD